MSCIGVLVEGLDAMTYPGNSVFHSYIIRYQRFISWDFDPTHHINCDARKALILVEICFILTTLGFPCDS